MAVTTRLGHRLSYRGAVVFADNARAPGGDFLAVSSIILPHPSVDELHEALREVDGKEPQSLLCLRGGSREQVVSMLEDFCNEGVPLESRLRADQLDMQGITAFQRHVYETTRAIPHGETRPYAWLAHKMKRRGSERAVGRALGCNPFPLLVPCHRVVKKDGGLGGFMGDETPASWQVNLKRLLLDVEEQHRQPSLFATQPRVARVAAS